MAPLNEALVDRVLAAAQEAKAAEESLRSVLSEVRGATKDLRAVIREADEHRTSLVEHIQAVIVACHEDTAVVQIRKGMERDASELADLLLEARKVEARLVAMGRLWVDRLRELGVS